MSLAPISSSDAVNQFHLLPIWVLVICLIDFVLAAALFSLRNKKEKAIKIKIEDLFEKTNLLQEELRSEGLRLESLRQRLRKYASLKALIDRLGSNLSLEDTAEVLVEESRRLVGKEDQSCTFYLVDQQSHVLSSLPSGPSCDSLEGKSQNGDIFDQWVLRHAEPLLVEDSASDFRFNYSASGRNIGALIAAALLRQQKLIGIIRMDSPHKKAFNLEDLRLFCTISDLASVTIDNALYYRHTKELAIKDVLTGLYLHNYILERLEQELKRCILNDAPLSILMLDVDHFKVYNDRYGHLAGDVVLRSLGLWLGEYTKGTDAVIGRFGGEEFLLVLPYLEKKDAFGLAENIRSGIQARTVVLRRKPSSITVSIGVAGFPLDGTLSNVLLEKVDHALYQAKRIGRNRVCLA